MSNEYNSPPPDQTPVSEEPSRQELITELQELLTRQANLRECDGCDVSTDRGSATLSITSDAELTIYFVISSAQCTTVARRCYANGRPVNCKKKEK